MANEPGGELRGLGVLVPRPQRRPDRFVDLLKARGAEVFVKPVIDIVPVAEYLRPGALASRLRGADALIFVSANAVKCCVDALAAAGEDLPGSEEEPEKSCDGPPNDHPHDEHCTGNPRYFAVGRSTAEQLAACGRRALYPRQRADSEGLLDLDELQDVSGRHIFICRGQGGRDKLAVELRQRGASVEYLDLYRRQPSGRYRREIDNLVESGQVRVVAIHSGEVLEAFLSCLGGGARHALSEITFLTPGERVANLISESGAVDPVVAPTALPEQMVEALVDWYTRTKRAPQGPRDYL